MAYEPKTWRLSDYQAGATKPDALDPQTSGDLWKIWDVARHDSVHCLYAVVNAGNRTGAHTHPDANHYTVVIKGTALVWIEGTIVRLEEGDIVSIPTGVLHDFGADTTGECWVVDLTTPPFDPEKMQFDPSREAEIAEAFQAAMTPRP
ncbi:cupin domain-containing protein [Mycolicibacterium pulveris]|uniref:Cupin type-2 domain-containing protein n=1 Tax=Mycolicibacterium pulveris TaxID=36813 RepID=A0A7I7UPK0_MYCPV|nr:cupin domain-containing protein [Mycolicibacterium pulveris]MCV6983525.1 cupin domain-containing protein [Mycolicibacterium pulveris]BBY83404.1 hypothetical protein MPUL_45620 [Mycolicibacterium pulveris]